MEMLVLQGQQDVMMRVDSPRFYSAVRLLLDAVLVPTAGVYASSRIPTVVALVMIY